jgi:hypothetical protein
LKARRMDQTCSRWGSVIWEMGRPSAGETSDEQERGFSWTDGTV